MISKIVSDIDLYDMHNIDELSELHHKDVMFYKSLLQNKVSHYIDNISAEIKLLKIDNEILPLLITSNNYQDSYVCSPYGNYVSLGLESLFLIKSKWLRPLAKHGLNALGSIVKSAKINCAVYVNHSMLSTDLHSDHLSQSQINTIISFLKTKLPNHAIIFRSVNSSTCFNLQKKLKSSGFKFIASRQIFLTETKNPELYKTRIIKSDLKTWNEKKHEVVSFSDFTPADEKRMMELCQSLAIDHHSKLNPKLNRKFFKLIQDHHPNLEIKALKINGVIEGIAGYQVKNKILHCSIFGYDKDHQNKTYIYRLLSTMLLLEAASHAEIFHQSAGASFYKTIRRAKPYQEYQAVYIKHLPLKQKMTWRFLKTFINTLAMPFMKKY